MKALEDAKEGVVVQPGVVIRREKFGEARLHLVAGPEHESLCGDIEQPILDRHQRAVVDEVCR